MPLICALPAFTICVTEFGPRNEILKVLPVLEVNRAIEAHAIARPTRLPPDLVVVQIVGVVGRQVTDAVDAAGPETLRVGGVDERLIGKSIRQVDLG